MKCKQNYHSICEWIRIRIRIRKAAQAELEQLPIMHIIFYQHQIVQYHHAHFHRQPPHRSSTETVKRIVPFTLQ